MPVSRLDVFYRRILLSKFFTKGWGHPDHIKSLLEFRQVISNRNSCYALVSKNYPIEVIKEETFDDCYIMEGKFITPLADYLPHVISPEIKDAHFQMLLPTKWHSDGFKPVCIHLAGTGDHYFWKRRNIMAKPLLKRGVGSIILENPYYGLRKPKSQLCSSLAYVSDIFVMGGCLILESLVLLHMCEDLGLGPLGITGLSMGGHMSSLAATAWPKPLVLVPCLSWSTASAVFTEGVMSNAIDWCFLQKQYFSDNRYYDILSKMCKVIDDPLESNLGKTDFLLFPENVHRKLKKCSTLTPYEILSLLNDCCSNYNESQNVVLSYNLRTLKITLGHTLAKLLTEHRTHKSKNKHALWFMRGLMDDCTHLKNFSCPYSTSLIIAWSALQDAYVPRDGLSRLEDIWPGATVKYLKGGHVSSYISHLNRFRSSIIEAFLKTKNMPLN